MAYVLGLDLGTSALKAVLMTEIGEWIAEASSDYPLISEKKDIASKIRLSGLKRYMWFLRCYTKKSQI